MNYSEMEAWTLDGLDCDYIPLDNIVRSFAKDFHNPTILEFGQTLNFLEEFIKNNPIKVLHGKEMQEFKFNNSSEVIDWLKHLWSKEPYQNFNYSIWFDKA
jgi:hypothetical protein